MTRTISVCAGLMLLAALLVAPAAQASLPKTDNTKIVPGLSIGGISLKTKAEKVKKKWKGGDCQTSDSYTHCNFNGKRETGGYANIGGAKKVYFVRIAVGYDSVKGKYVFGGKMTKFKTDEGVGLGTKVKKLKKLENIKKDPSGNYVVKGGKKSVMIFSLDPRTNKVVAITLSSGQGG